MKYIRVSGSYSNPFKANISLMCAVSQMTWNLKSVIGMWVDEQDYNTDSWHRSKIQ